MFLVFGFGSVLVILVNICKLGLIKWLFFSSSLIKLFASGVNLRVKNESVVFFLFCCLVCLI